MILAIHKRTGHFVRRYDDPRFPYGAPITVKKSTTETGHPTHELGGSDAPIATFETRKVAVAALRWFEGSCRPQSVVEELFLFIPAKGIEK